MATRTRKAARPGRDFTGPDDDPQVGVLDTGDQVDPGAEDPDPPEVGDPRDPSFVVPAEVE